MLYVTTRVRGDAFTAIHALTENRGPEGGFFVPMRLPHFDAQQIAELENKPFAHIVAEILNQFFGTQIDGHEMELGIGRYPVKLIGLNGKITVAKTWHNPVNRFDRLISGAEKVIRQSDLINKTPSDWMQIATRIAVLFGIYGQFLHEGIVSKQQSIDVAIPSGDLSKLMAAWYAREMGLPIETIVCCCNENHALWNLFHKGEFRTDAIARQTHTHDCDYVVPTDLERLIFAVFSYNETERFQECCMTGGAYYLEEEQIKRLREGIHISVVGEKRVASTIPNLYKTTGFLPDPYTALAYGGLTDYRSITGSNRPALLVSEESPIFSLDFTAQCMDMLPEKLKELLN